jgi:Protein of unknown function (DUF2971)
MYNQSGPAAAPPTLLYHYTSLEGVMGILRSKTLWATELGFLNDRSEFEHARDLFRAALDRLANPALDPDHPFHDIVDQLDDEYAALRRSVSETLGRRYLDTYVVSFCESGDLLSQWRTYAAGGGGYAIEFEFEGLRQAAQEAWQEFGILDRVDYGQEEFIQKSLDAIRHSNLSMGKNMRASGEVMQYLVRIKHASFAEEREWRVAVNVKWSDLTRFEDSDVVRFRAGPYGATPYLELPFNTSAIRGVVVGPGLHADTRATGVARLLEVQGIHAEVRASSAPLR